MKKYILTVTVNPALDATLMLPGAARPAMACGTGVRMRGQHYEPGALPTAVTAGGKGINVARVLQALGTRALAAGLAGGGTGVLLERLLRAENIPAALVRVRESTRVNLTILGPGTGNCYRLLGDGPRLNTKEIRKFEQRYVSLLRASRWIVLSGRNACGAPQDWYARLIRLASRQGVPAAVDTSGHALAAALKAKPFLIKPNREEAQTLTGKRLKSPAQIQKALTYFHRSGIRLVLLSLGARGAVLSDGKEVWTATAPAVPVWCNDVGCGDALLAGFLHACTAREEASWGDGFLPEALRLGVACGTANTLDPIPGRIRLTDVRRLARKVTVRKSGV